MTDIYKLARPMLRGVPFQITAEGQVNGDIKNHMAREILGGLPAFKGEIVIGKPQAPECYERSRAFCNDEKAIHLFVAWVYDIRTTAPFDLKKRLSIAESFVHTCGPNIQYVDHTLVQSQADVDRFKALVIKDRGFPGIVLREPYGTFGTEDETITAETVA